MTDNPGILGRIDEALDDYDQWDGHSPDAARWAGGPDESEWPDRTDQYSYTPDRSLADALADMVNGQTAEQMQAPPSEPLTVEGLERVMRRVRDATPRVFAGPATAAAIREAAQAVGQRVAVVETPQVPDGTAYVFRPPPQMIFPEHVPYRFESVCCCHAGRVAFPDPCPWHGGRT